MCSTLCIISVSNVSGIVYNLYCSLVVKVILSVNAELSLSISLVELNKVIAALSCLISCMVDVLVLYV